MILLIYIPWPNNIISNSRFCSVKLKQIKEDADLDFANSRFFVSPAKYVEISPTLVDFMRDCSMSLEHLHMVPQIYPPPPPYSM